MSKFPIKLKEYLHSDKFWETDKPDLLIEQGYSEDDLPRYLVYELELDVEIHQGGEVLITHVEGQKLNTPIST